MGPGHSAGIFIRGASSQSTLVLVDGVRIGSATLGQVSFDAIGLAQIERIEVLRGTNAVLYGEGATAGVIVITEGIENNLVCLAALGSMGIRAAGWAENASLPSLSSFGLEGSLPKTAGKVIYLHCAAGGRCLKAADLLAGAP